MDSVFFVPVIQADGFCHLVIINERREPRTHKLTLIIFTEICDNKPAFLQYYITPLLITEYAACGEQVSVVHFQLTAIGMIIYVLLQFVRNLTENIFLSDKVFCQICTVTHIIVTYLVLMIDKFIKLENHFC